MQGYRRMFRGHSGGVRRPSPVSHQHAESATRPAAVIGQPIGRVEGDAKASRNPYDSARVALVHMADGRGV
jgi:hypothetical protein